MSRRSQQPPHPLEEAYTLLKIGQRDPAVAILREYTREHPHDAEGWWLVANALEDPAEVHRALLRTLRENPDHKHAANKLAQLTQETGDPTLRREPKQKYRARPAEVASNADVTLSRRAALVETPAENPARPPSRRAGARKRKRAKSARALVILSLILAILVVTFMGVLLILITTAGAPTPIPPTPNQTPQAAFQPTEFSGSELAATVRYEYENAPTPPCAIWRISGRVDALTESDDRVIRIVAEQSGYDAIFEVNAVGTYRAEIPAQEGAVSVYIYDAESIALGGLVNVRLGTDAIPTCAAVIDFHRS